MMTSFAFILGLLVIVVGSSALNRRAIGTPVFGGMIAAAASGIFLAPMLYVVFQRLREGVASGRSVGRSPLAAAKGLAAP